MTYSAINTAHDDDAPDGLRGGAWPVGWQDIASAPKNRTVLVGARNALDNWRTYKATFYTQLEWSDDYDPTEDDGPYAPEGWYEETDTHDTLLGLNLTPTHWMPLPTPPVGAA